MKNKCTPSYEQLMQRAKELESQVATGGGRSTDLSLQESCEIQRCILSTITEGFWLVDSNGKLLDVNSNYSRQSGYSRQELLGMHTSDLEVKRSADEIVERIEHVAENGSQQFSKHYKKSMTRAQDRLEL